MVAPSACLTGDELLELGASGLADTPAAEAHLAECSTCSSLLASIVRAPRRSWDALAGTTVGPYRVDAQIGGGAMGAVYRAWDPKLSRAIALKVLHRGDGTAIAEARAAAAIDHRAVVAIYDVGVADDLAYVAMELVTGEVLRAILDRGAVGDRRARELMRELADGLAAAHGCGVIHRDLKPENLIVARDGLRILDFGLAATAGTTGTVGTPGYMAPELARGEPADARTDLFAAGAIGYELVTGRRAFPGASPSERLAAALRSTPALDGLGGLAPIIARCLAKDPRDRFQSAADLAWALGAADPPAPRPTRRAMLVGAAGALATGLVGFALGRRRSSASLAVRTLSHRSGRIATARFSPDGARVTYGAAWDSDPVRVFELELGSGEAMALDLPSADVLAVSRVDLAVALDRTYVDHDSARGRLAIMRRAGGDLRPVAEDVQEADFAVDGLLAVVRPHGSGFVIELPIGTPLVEHAGWITDVRVSPDRTRVAYFEHPQTDDDGGSLIIVDIATKDRRTVSRGWVSLAGLAWEAKGEAVVFGGSRQNWATRRWRVSLDGGETELASPVASRLRVHDISERGTLVSLDQRSQRVMIGDRDATLSDAAYVVDLSADGTQVVVGEYGSGASGTYLVPTAGGRVLRLGAGFPAAISPSGGRVAVNQLEPQRLVAYSTRSAETLPIAAPDFILRARWIDERTLVAAIHDSLWRLSLDGPAVKIADGGGRIALDPERKRCAYVDDSGRLHVLDLSSNATRIIAQGLTQHSVGGWLAERDAIVVRWTGVPIRLELFDPLTGARTPFRVIEPPRLGLKAIDNFVMHAGGAHFAYSFGQEIGTLALVT